MQAFRSAAERLGEKLEILGADITTTAPALKFVDKGVVVPRISDEDYIPFLKKICTEEKIDALIPTIDTDLLLFSQHRDEFGNTRVFISSPDKVKICRDKRFTADYFESLGLKSPHPVDEVEKYKGGFPAFIKPKDGSSSINAYRVSNEADLREIAARVPDYIIQPFITGTEYTVDIFCDWDGEPVFITPRIRLAVRAGEVLKTEIRQDKQIISEMKRLCRDFKPRGQITVQLIKTKDGTDWYIEINPRFGGGAPLSIKAGADSAEAVIRLLRGEGLSYQPHAVTDGAIYSRFDQSVRVDE
jgi:carbamoyl-phosphate synthase large subunit